MSPLKLIHDWFLQEDDATRSELVHLAAAYHPTASMDAAMDDAELITLFEAYLTEEIPSKKEVVQRVFFIKSLLEACLFGRDTEEGWEVSKRRNAYIHERATQRESESLTQIYDKFLETFDERKAKWIAWSAQWQELVNDKLRYDNLYYYGLGF